MARTQMLVIIFTILNEKAKGLAKMSFFKSNMLWLNQLIICFNIDQFFEVLEFVFMSGGLLIIVSFNLMTLRLYDSVPFTFWCYFPVSNFLTDFSIQMSVPKFALIANLAEQYVVKLKLESGIAKNPYFVRRTKAIFAIQLKAGLPGYPFICFIKSTTLDFYSAIINHTINIILAVP